MTFELFNEEMIQNVKDLPDVSDDQSIMGLLLGRRWDSALVGGSIFLCHRLPIRAAANQPKTQNESQRKQAAR